MPTLNSSLKKTMKCDLPPLTEQRSKIYRPSLKETIHYYELINEKIFNSHLIRPKIILQRCHGYWGKCVGYDFLQQCGSYCEIYLSDKWYCQQWFLTVLSHEMSHQYQFDIIGPKLGKDSHMSHGPTFFKFKNKLEQHGIPLKIAHSTRKWFKYQNMFRC